MLKLLSSYSVSLLQNKPNYKMASSTLFHLLYLKKTREDICRLASDDKQAGVEFAQAGVQVL